jgi:hypothetical protein
MDRTTGASATAAVALLPRRISRSRDPFYVEDGPEFFDLGLLLTLSLALPPATMLSLVMRIGISAENSMMFSIVVHVTRNSTISSSTLFSYAFLGFEVIMGWLLVKN